MPSDAGGDDIDDGRWSALLAEQSRRHAPLFFRVAHGVVRDPDAAEDACQAAFLKAWEHRRAIADPAKVRAWISRVVLNESLLIARRRKVERKARELGYVSHDSDSAGHRGTPYDHADLRDALFVALEQLPETTRLVFVLREMHAESGNAVSDLLGCSRSEVSRLLQEGRRRVRELMADYDVGRPDA